MALLSISTLNFSPATTPNTLRAESECVKVGKNADPCAQVYASSSCNVVAKKRVEYWLDDLENIWI